VYGFSRPGGSVCCVMSALKHESKADQRTERVLSTQRFVALSTSPW